MRVRELMEDCFETLQRGRRRARVEKPFLRAAEQSRKRGLSSRTAMRRVCEKGEVYSQQLQVRCDLVDYPHGGGSNPEHRGGTGGDLGAAAVCGQREGQRGEGVWESG